MYWRNGTGSVDGAKKVKMPQFTLEHFEVISNVVALSTGKQLISIHIVLLMFVFNSRNTRTTM